MKWIRIIALIVFAAAIVAPLAHFNTTPEAVSEIDNRILAENPFGLDGDLTLNIQNYVNDRIGFRDEMITAYTVLNDKLFHKMVHPIYTYGKDGYIFGAGLKPEEFGDFHIAFADTVAAIQKYCEERNVPFLFVFDPAKPAIYQEKIADGIHYNRQWVDQFFAELDKRGVNYLDNTETMLALKNNGIHGFNQKYDANHWNDLGAFYGTNAILERLNIDCKNIHINELDEFTRTEKLETSLLVSKFAISEYVPEFCSNAPSPENIGGKYLPEIELHPAYRSFGYYRNDNENVKKTPKALVFQGSYMNEYGAKYLKNAFREYIHIHDYQNVLDLPYYFNIFQPECVVFEAAEYVFSNPYFNYIVMSEIDYNPALTTLDPGEYTIIDVSEDTLCVEQGETLTTITWHTDPKYHYVWMVLDSVYDMRKVDNGFQVTIETDRFEGSKDQLKIYAAEYPAE